MARQVSLALLAGAIQQSDLKPSLAVPRNGIDAWLAYWTGLAADYPKREDGTPHILQEEEAYIAYLCGVINEYPEKCLRRVGAYLRYLISARWGRPDHPLNREELYLSLLKTQVIPSGDPSSDIKIDGTAKAPFQDVKMYGDTFQQTSPSPDYPQPIQTVTGEQTVTVVGKNLLNVKDNLKTSASGLDFTFSDNKLVVSGTPTQTYTTITNEIDVDLPAGNYTFSISNAINHRVYIRVYYEDSTYADTFLINAGSTSKTGTLAKKVERIRIDFSLMTIGTAINESFALQLEKGSTTTAYEPYSSNDYYINLGEIELCKIGVYQDYIYKDDGEWKIRNKIVKTKLVSTLSGWSIASFDTQKRLYIPSQNAYGAQVVYYTTNNEPAPQVSSHFTNISATDLLGGETGIAISSSGYLSIRDNNQETAQGFKDWIDENEPVAYAVRAVPTNIPITNHSLIAQLEALAEGGAENGTTYIKVSATGSNLPGLLYVEAPKYE